MYERYQLSDNELPHRIVHDFHLEIYPANEL